MAAKDNQGLQAIVIVLALLVVGLAVGIFLINNARKTEKARADSAEQSASQAASSERQIQEEANNYKEAMGFSRDVSYEAMQKSISEDLQRYGQNFEEEDRNYHTILDQIFQENRKLADNEAEAKQLVAKLEGRLAAIVAEKEEQITQYRAEAQAAAEDLAREKNKFEEEYARINKENEQLAAQFENLQQEHAETVAQLNQTRAQLEQKIASLQDSIEKLKLKQPEEDPFAQPADGEITWVNQAENKVWVNIGSKDGLRPQVTFSVFEVGQPDADQAVKKASIEIVQILSGGMAEAKITGDDQANPVMPGDKIYSPAWAPGRQVGFAIAGFIDIDGDGSSDLEQLKRIIAANGGKVDVAPNAEGEKEGDAQVETRFLILGDRSESPNRTAWARSYDQISEEAGNLAIPSIPLQQFLELIGWKNDSDVVPLGIDARESDFAAQPREQELPRRSVAPTGAFRKRLPKVSY